MRPTFALCLAAALVLAFGCARPTDPEKPDAPVRRLEGASPEAAALAQRIGALLPNAQAGVAVGFVAESETTLAFAGNPTFSAETLFEFGSITKLATAHLVARRLLSGELDLEAPLVSLPGGSEIGEAWSATTLQQLLTHSSGLSGWPPNWGPVRIVLTGQLGDPFARYDGEDLLAGMQRQRRPLPGEDWVYSNYAFAVLGRVLEETTGTSYAALLQDEFLDPLGLSAATIEGWSGDQIAPPLGRRGGDATLWSFGAFAPAGALRGNVRDGLAFLRHALAACEGTDTPARATCLTQRSQHFPMNGTSEMGLGWVRSARANDTIVWHNGGTGGFSTFLGFVEGEDRGVVVLTNVGFLREIDTLAMDALALGERTRP